MSKIFVVDNYDSFTFNLVHMLKELSDGSIKVKRNDQFELSELEEFDKIVLSPGPGVPSEAGLMPELVKRYADSKSILGVCLGHQCIGEVFGAKLSNLDQVFHGKGIETKVTVPDPIFSSVPETFVSARYHSWVVDQEAFPEVLEVTAIDDSGLIMALRHKALDVRGVQFHPESILTEVGGTIINNWLSL